MIMRLIDADALRESIITRQPEISYEDAWALTCVDNAPTIEPQKWIPCSERLPEYKQAVLTYIGYLDDYEVNWICDEDDEWYHYGVTAWMELPDPYGENKN